jgi:hypothetical protein
MTNQTKNATKTIDGKQEFLQAEPEEILEPELQSVAGGAACNNNSAAPHLVPSV